MLGQETSVLLTESFTCLITLDFLIMFASLLSSINFSICFQFDYTVPMVQIPSSEGLFINGELLNFFFLKKQGAVNSF